MTSALAWTRDSIGCLAGGRWGGFLASRGARLAQAAGSTPEVSNETGLREIRVRTSSFVCAGQAQPNDHPHVSLKLGKAGEVRCPYCNTRFRMDSLNPATGDLARNFGQRRQ